MADDKCPKCVHYNNGNFEDICKECLFYEDEGNPVDIGTKETIELMNHFKEKV